jgi:hypothetical protein
MGGERGQRQARRDFIRAHHPDAGGDPAAFIAGLAALSALGSASARVIGVPNARWPARMKKALQRRMGWRQPPPRVK